MWRLWQAILTCLSISSCRFCYELDVGSSTKEKGKDRATKDRPKDRSTKKHKKKDEKKDKKKAKHQEPLVDLYCAIYTPHFGNYYHWAFATHNQATSQWHLFQVVQDEQDGPFRPEGRQTNPTNSERCHQPLTFLGQMHPGWWDTLVQQIGMIQVPGEGLGWNCQDYVMDIWDALQAGQMIDELTWYEGREEMLPYYGQDFGGDADEESEEYEEQEEQEGQVMSQEFVYDSSE
ncbi:hypothetical protein HYQ46_009814 [Verticillium longisporum]|nr:hypothetical protein HYQ44_002170 [Verticillium longisporum]KAG7130832.1 hypothetical protein HYQ46_009814 [Verticillium longisporum]